MSSFKRSCIFVVSAALVSGAIRLPMLGERPMHGDEAVQAVKTGRLVEEGTYQYDPEDCHGPTLYYFSLIGAWLSSADTAAKLDESILRGVTVFFGILLVLAVLLLWDGLGWFGVSIAGVLTALSPAFVFYSRYYIQEMLLVFFTFAVIVSGYRYVRSKNIKWAIGTGVFAGLMLATKETAIIAMGSMFAAVLVMLFLKRRGRDGEFSLRKEINLRDVLGGVVSAGIVVVVFYSSFFTNPKGVIDFFTAYSGYFGKAVEGQKHLHPWSWYLGLITYHTGGGLVWTEGFIVVLAVFGGLFTLSKRYTKGFDLRLVRFVAVYTLVMVFIYSAIPYKTPWSMLSFFHGMILLAGVGGSVFVQMANTLWRKAVVFFVLIAGVFSLCTQGFNANFVFYASPGNPYVYAHPTTDVLAISKKVHNIAGIHPRREGMYIQVICPESDYWPLPWYFRDLNSVGYRNRVDEGAAISPVFIASPAVERELLEYIYNSSAAGEKSLYVPLFEEAVYLRPQVELRGYIKKELLDKYRAKVMPVTRK